MTSTPLAAPLLAPFDGIAATYDEVFTDSIIGRAQRDSVWRELDRSFHVGQHILEINCGTGVDAVHLAARGVEVLACDISAGMLEVARRRVQSLRLLAPVRLRRTAIEDISCLRDHAPFDGALSNFGGLNCIENLWPVARDLAQLVRPGARVVICSMGRCVGWEIAVFAARGRFREGFRRLGPGPVYVRLGLERVPCWYPAVGALRRTFAPGFRLLRWKGVGLTVPPSYLERHAQRFPRAIRALAKADLWLGRVPLLRVLADHYLLTFERI
jgi:ubiquinone/menaquinone biosynthesis C-methylase UbiE